ncbi:MAG: hypothetical protein EZS28_010003 [Streblomastix strix]|uniref:Uncharacterized protein n=1 Tax=Streblomastix strix TaxID=222440 RepID=A0A5J4WID0_9EUKA|nr:MAG: hypothetical protein EZS28_010003 [Streblomastix strix]
MTLPTEEVNQEKDQDQEVIQDLGNTRVQEKLEQMRIEIIMDLKPETNQELEDEERLEEEGKIIKEGTHQFEDNNRGEGWDDNPNDDWTKRTQMQKDPPDNHSDRESTWTEDEAPQHHVTPPQLKQPAQQTQQVQQIHVQPKQQAPAQVPKKKERIGQLPNQDDIDEQEIIQERLATLYKEKEEMGISESDVEWQRLKKAERELEELKTKQQLQQQENSDLNNTNVETLDIQGTVGQLTGLQPSPIAESQGLNAGLRPMEVGSISASNRERTEPQINEGHDDNADEEEDEQSDEAALNKNKDYRINANTQPPVQENLGTQPLNDQGLNALSQMEKDNTGPAPVGVQEKPKRGK